ncbi:MAG: hypothetical protein HON65_16600 [Rhodospirillales bacterium]|jgi:hypothetical protein|nr:hypothetical protein [Rhodospirillales bacterium]
MADHYKEIATKFCELCDWLLQAWQFRKFMFEENPDFEYLKTRHHEHFFNRLQKITQEYWLLQLAKLHDPATANKSKNLTIDYMIDYVDWEKETKLKLNDLRNRMQVLSKPTKIARNKILSHNDLNVLLDNQTLGEFQLGDDEKYFNCLKDFANIVSLEINDSPFIFDDLVPNDIAVFMNSFKRGCKAKRA